jgi:maltose-binding protein MalE
MQRFQPLLQYGQPLPKHPKWTEIAAILTAALDEVYLRNRPAKEALDDAARKADGVLR